jgi:hypothetical protein
LSQDHWLPFGSFVRRCRRRKVRRRNLVPWTLALSIIIPATRAQVDGEYYNNGDHRQYSLRPGEFATRILARVPSDENQNLASEKWPMDSYVFVGLKPGEAYKVIIEKVGGISGFTVYDTPAKRNSGLFNITRYDIEFTVPQNTSNPTYGPVSVALHGGWPSLLFDVVTNTTYQISVGAVRPTLYFEAPDETHPNGTLIKARDSSDQTVYIIENGSKRPFVSAYHFDSWFFGRWDRVISVKAAAIGRYVTGASMPFRDGTVLKYSDRASDKTVFVIDSGLRRAFQRWDDFIALGYLPNEIKAVPGRYIDEIPRGSDIVRQLSSSITPAPGQSVTLQLTFEPNPVSRTALSECSGGSGYSFAVRMTVSGSRGVTPRGLDIDGSTSWMPRGYNNRITANASVAHQMIWCRSAGTSTWTATGTDDSGQAVIGRGVGDFR